MTRRTRRNHTPAFKAKLASAAVKGDATLAELSKRYDVHANQIATWKEHPKLTPIAVGCQRMALFIPGQQ